MSPNRRVTIIGSGPAGLTAALYAARANLKPLVIEGVEAGGQLMLTTMVENFPGFREGIMGPELMADMRAQAERFGAEIIQGNVTKADLTRRPFKLEVADKLMYTETLIIATGASARLIGLPAERALLGHGVSTCATCDGFFFRGKPIAVVGGGDSALEEATFLTKFASKVTVIHRRDTLRASKIMQDKAFENEKIDFAWNSEIEDILDTSKGFVTSVLLRDNVKGDITELPVEGVFIAIGHTPNTGLFAGQLAMDRNGYIITNKGTCTNIPGVFACGDVQDHIYRQAVTAAGTGCMAAIDAERWLEHVPRDVEEETTRAEG
jgi:thioredoxin reductase (NADPH)